MRTLNSVLISLLLAIPCTAATIIVDANGTGDYPTIQAAINAANTGDVIKLQPGTYEGDGNRDIDFLGKAITVCSLDPNDPNIVSATIIDCGLNWSQLSTIRGFYFQSGEGPDSVISGLTIRDGHVLAWDSISGGGAIVCMNSSPTIRQCVIKDSRLNEYNLGGAAIFCNNNSQPRIIRCIITDNTAVELVPGGGIFCRNGSDAVISNCTITNNSSYSGGGISIRDSSPTISNCLITGNSVVHDGGGIYFLDSSPAIRGCTITDNSSDDTGAGICSKSSSSTIIHCIIWGNSSRHPANVEVHGTSPTILYSDIEGGFAGNGNLNIAPLFVNPTGSNYHLSAYSPCINTGDPNYVPEPYEVDIDGDSRLINGLIDMGADELNYTGPIICPLPAKLKFEAYEDGNNPETKLLGIHNIGTGTMDWEITENCPWLEVDPNRGFWAGEVNEVSVSVDTSGMAWGTYNCLLTINSNAAINSGLTLEVTLFIYIDYAGALHVPMEYPTIQAAINDANDGDIVIVGDGIYTGDGNRDIDFLGKAITVKSENGASNCIIDCQGSETDPHRAFIFQSGEDTNSVVCGFTITGGLLSATNESGAAILCFEPGPKIMNCIFNDNASLFGTGGAVGLVNIFRSKGGEFINCTFSNNSAYYGGGAIHFEGCDFSGSQVRNCIIWNNIPSDNSGIYQLVYDKCQRYPPTVELNILQNPWYSDELSNIVADPCFIDAANGNYHLNWDSPGIDAGDPNYITEPNEIDMDGEPRIINERIDIGADEFNNTQPIIGISPTILEYYAEANGNNPQPQIFSIWNIGPGTLNWRATENCTWLEVEPDSGHLTNGIDDVNVSVDISGLVRGRYSCELIISDANALNSPQIIQATLVIRQPVIRLSTNEFSFNALIDGPYPQAQVLGISNSGEGTLNWEIIYDCNWLTVVPDNGSSTGETDEVSLSVDITGLNEGTYNCELTISDPCAGNSPQTVGVDLIVHGPIINLSDNRFIFFGWIELVEPEDQVLTIRNSGARTLNWEIIYDCNWLTVDPVTGSSMGEPNDVTLSVDTTGLPKDTYNCELIISDPCAENNPQIVTVILTIECFPNDHPDYDTWVFVGRPECWCYPRQCLGDADGLPYGAKTKYWVSIPDLTILKNAWNKPLALLVGNEICADFDHLYFSKSGYRVSIPDLTILKNNWSIPNGPEPNCPGSLNP